MATHSSILPGIISRTEEPGGLQSIGSHRVRHDRVTFTSLQMKRWERLVPLEPVLHTHRGPGSRFYRLARYLSLPRLLSQTLDWAAQKQHIRISHHPRKHVSQDQGKVSVLGWGGTSWFADGAFPL